MTTMASKPRIRLAFLASTLLLCLSLPHGCSAFQRRQFQLLLANENSSQSLSLLLRNQHVDTVGVPRSGRFPCTSHDSNPRTTTTQPHSTFKTILHGLRGGGAGTITSTKMLSQSQRQRLVVLLVTTALFNDMLQLTMLLPIIHTLITSPPPLGIASSLSSAANGGSGNNEQVLLGLFFASKDICQMAFAPLAGILTAQTSSHTSLLLSTAGLAMATLVFANAQTFSQLLIARGAQGAASAAVMCGGLSLIAETHEAENNVRGGAMAMAQTGLALGLLCGPLIGGLLFERLGRVNTFRLASGIVGLNALGQMLFMGLAPPERVNYHGNDGKQKNAAIKNKKSIQSLMKSTKELLSNHDILAISAATLVIHAVVGVIKPLSQVVLDKEFGITMVHRSLIISIATVAYFITTPLCGYYWSNRVQRSHLVGWSLVLMFGSSAFFALRSLIGIWAFYISVGLLGVALGLFKCSSPSLLADLVDRNNEEEGNDGAGSEYSMVYALSDVADSLGMIVGPIVGLYLSQVFGPSVGVIAIGGLSLLLAPIVMRIP